MTHDYTDHPAVSEGRDTIASYGHTRLSDDPPEASSLGTLALVALLAAAVWFFVIPAGVAVAAWWGVGV